MKIESYITKDNQIMVACIESPHRSDIEVPSLMFARIFTSTFPQCTCKGPYQHRDFCMPKHHEAWSHFYE